ncbi:MAG TPA: NUDIX domain-containing protein [Bacteroidales bacterium]|nr:NUDIX domain-containing protein [Bacteroidales bacterium]
MFKIYYNNKILLLSESAIADNSFAKISFLQKENIKNALKIFLKDKNALNLNIYELSTEKLPDFISENFKLINAGGGIVINKSNNILYIFRRGFYDFPKGKIEKHESVKNGALREVSEECGISISDLNIEKKLDNVYHIYFLNGQYILKNTTWYLMKFSGDYPLTPQITEDITEIGWMKKSELEKFSSNTYPSLVDLVNMIADIV